jgi:hypothetical protein
VLELQLIGKPATGMGAMLKPHKNLQSLMRLEEFEDHR